MLENISQLKKLEATEYNAIVEGVKGHQELADIWQEPYPEYASAGLKVATLLNPTGEQENFDYRDCKKPVATPLLDELKAIGQFFEKSKLHIMGARLLRLEPNTFLHEHRDFIYLEEVERYRLHMPIITNARAHIVSPDVNVHFKAGYLWKLDPKNTIHSACNFGGEPRIHLMIDCYMNDALKDLLNGQFLDEDACTVKPAFTSEDKETAFAIASQIISQGKENLTKAEEIILALFCRFNLYKLQKGLTTYDLLAEFFDREANSPNLAKNKIEASFFAERKTYWDERLVETYPERKNLSLADLASTNDLVTV